MKVEGIDRSTIEAMLARLQSVAREAHLPHDVAKTNTLTPTQTAKFDFPQVLKEALDGVAHAQNHADTLGKRFSMGDDNVNLSDVMMSMQKANISFQAMVQVRNRLVSAYQETMGMQI